MKRRICFMLAFGAFLLLLFDGSLDRVNLARLNLEVLGLALMALGLAL